MTLEALARHGSVDLLYVGEADGRAAAVPEGAPITTVTEHRIARRRLGLAERAAWVVRPRRPLQVIGWEVPAAPPWLPEQDYDLVWYFRGIAYALVGVRGARATVVDLDDLEDDKLRRRRSVLGSHDPARRRLVEARNAVAWRRFQRTIAAAVDAVTVCSREDCRRLGSPNCLVLPNGYPAGAVPGQVAHEVRTLLFVGLFGYEPNADAAEFLVREVVPLIREEIPEVQLRLVGRPTPRIERLAGPGVVVVGEVSDLAAEYARAGIAVAPIRFGGGTRIKIIEAFARRVPVVSTTMGAEGLGVRDGVELLLADDTASFARACVRLIEDSRAREDLIIAAYECYEQRFSQAAVSRHVDEILDAVL
jgi:glycosyltransferase involved in cell wall biosynthesis